jgi:hypothetical protein
MTLLRANLSSWLVEGRPRAILSYNQAQAVRVRAFGGSHALPAPDIARLAKLSHIRLTEEEVPLPCILYIANVRAITTDSELTGHRMAPQNSLHY